MCIFLKTNLFIHNNSIKMSNSLMNSTIYHRQCKMTEYTKQIKRLESMIEGMKTKSEEKCRKLRKNDIGLCKYMNVDDDTFKKTFVKMVDDYIGRKTRYCSNSTLYDVCLRQVSNRFKSVFSSPGTHNILLAFYEYIDKIPK